MNEAPHCWKNYREISGECRSCTYAEACRSCNWVYTFRRLRGHSAAEK